MLRVAKLLLFLIENKGKQIPRYAPWKDGPWFDGL